MKKKNFLNKIRNLFNNPILKLFYLLVLFGIVIYCILRWKDKFYSLVSEANLSMIPWIFGCSCGVVMVYVFIQYKIYRGIGVYISFPKIFKIMTLAQLGKYVPGKVLFAGNYFLFSREARVKAKDIGTSFVISQCLWFLSACICSIPVIYVLSSPLRYSIVFLPLIVALLIHPKVLNWILSLLERIIQRYLKSGEKVNLQISEHISYIFYIKIILLYLLGWIIAGLGVYLTVCAFQPIEIGYFPLCLSLSALSIIIGFIAIFAPMGLGVREGIGIAILTPIISVETAFLVMLLLRVVGIVIHLSFALFSVLFIRTSSEQKSLNDLYR